jgi:hypothetical protein
MKIAPLALALALLATPAVLPVHAQGLVADEQILMKQVMTDKRAVYAKNLDMSESESRAFWPIYSEYEVKLKKVDDEFLALVNEFAEKYDTLNETDATRMLKTKMRLEKERMALKQTYTSKIAKVLPPVKALRYAQVETRIENLVRREVYGLIPLAR